ncbi:MAG: hypothetical protein WBF17_13670 [Phycisphaerae bacterium]|jgi:hypothetical protein
MNESSKAPKRGTVKRFVEAGDMVVVVEVPVIYAPEQPDEPLLEAETIRFLDEVTRRAQAGEKQWLRNVGRVYEPART